MEDKIFSSGIEFRMDKEFVYYNFPNIRKENSPAFGVDSARDIVITPIVYDELNYILNSDGRHVILFGGVWSEKTQAVIDVINCFARKYDINSVYLYDFSADGEGENTSVKTDITEQESYNGPGKQAAKACAEYNYQYGEIVSRNLTDLASWTDPDKMITYLNLYCEKVKVPAFDEPFLFAYDRTNPLGPIIYAVNPDCIRNQLSGEIIAEIEKLFAVTREHGGVEPYTHQDYMFDAFRQNERGHSFKTEDAFKKDELINIIPVTIQELRWILSQKGSFMVLFAGAWCANSQACIATINDYAVANDVIVYMIDIRIDGKYPIDFWEYPRARELRLNNPALKNSYIDLWERCLPGAPILCKVSNDTPGNLFNPYITDDEGNQHAVLNVDIPYILAVNKDRVSERGSRIPVLAACNHDGFELINCNKSFIYYKPNYRKYTAGIYYVMNAYCDSLGIEVKDIEIDRSAPIVEGTPVKNPNIKGEVKYFRSTPDDIQSTRI